MAKKFKRLICTALVIVMCLSSATMLATAAEGAETVWYGDGFEVQVEPGHDEYTFMGHYGGPYHSYEISNHFVLDEAAGKQQTQLFMMLDASGDEAYTWTPNGKYSFGTSNYDLVYCCDVDTGYVDGSYYKRTNLEDSSYFTDEQARHIRAIVTNSYPYISMEEMKANLAEVGFEGAEDLTRADIITAVQAAIWGYANGGDFAYNGTYNVTTTTKWGAPLHDFTNEMEVWWNTKTGKFSTNEEVGNRINNLIAFLMELEEVYAAPEQVVISDIQVVEVSPVEGASDVYDVTIEVALNNSGSSDNDDIKLDVFLNDEMVETKEVQLGADVYSVTFQAQAGATIKAAVSGTQVLAGGVYFYEPEGGRGTSQSMVGAAMGETEIYSEAVIELTDEGSTKTATDLIDDRYTDVTLTVGGEATSAPVDIVVALGAGIAKEENTVESLEALVQPLVAQGVDVKLGLIAVEHYDDVAMELTGLTEANYKEVIANGLATIKAMPAGPTNLHGNIEAAKAMLDADTSVAAENKYFYVIGTGRTYNFDNEEGVPTTIVNKVALKGNTYYYWGHYLWQAQRGEHTSLYRVPVRYANDWDAYWADVCAWVEADGDAYAYSFPNYDTTDPQWFNTYYAENSDDAKELGLASSRFGWIIGELTNSGKAAIGSGSNPQNALNYERAQYEAWETYTEMVDAGYNCYSLCSESVAYQNYSVYMTVQGVTPGLQLGHSFMDFLASESGRSEDEKATVLFELLDDNGNYEMIENFFAPIEVGGASATSIEEGTYVVDYIGYDADEVEGYDYTFLTDAEYLALTINGVAYEGTKLDVANEGATASYVFAAPGTQEAAIAVDYFMGNGTTEEHFVWTFLDTVSGPASLTYRLELTTRSAVAGEHTTFTNQSATIYPPEGNPEVFEKPVVDYVVEEEDKDMIVSFKSGQASNISFMLIDKETGEVEFVEKIDIGGETSFQIPAEEGKISAVFIKQSTSGMFWVEEVVSDEVLNNVIECLKDHNPSYKGHNAVAFGDGEHELEFKKNKFATYTFTGAGEAIVEQEDAVVEDVVVEEPVIEEPVVEEPVIEESDDDQKEEKNNKNKEKNNGNNKNKNKKK